MGLVVYYVVMRLGIGPMSCCLYTCVLLVNKKIPAGVSGFFVDIKYMRSRYGLGVDSTSNRNEYLKNGDRGSTEVKVLCYNSEGSRFDPSWCQWIFHLHDPSDHTMALGSTQPLTEMSTRSISWG